MKKAKANVISIKTRKQSMKFPDYCTGYFREDKNEKLKCPRCGDMLPTLHTASLSWDGKTEICNECGDNESYEAIVYGHKEYDPYRACNQKQAEDDGPDENAGGAARVREALRKRMIFEE